MRVAVGVAFAALATASPSFAQAQRADVHLNPVVAKLAAGETVYGLINSGDLSLANARETARAPVDFVYADMEHNPLDFPGLRDLPARHDGQGGDSREGQPAAERRAVRALSARGRPVRSGSSNRRSTSG